MRRRPFRRSWTSRSYRGCSPKTQVFLSVLLGISLAFFLIHQFNRFLRPQLIAFAETQIRNQLTLTANQAVAQTMNEQALSYEDLVIFRSGEGEAVTTLSTDTIRLNILRSAVLDEIVLQVEALDDRILGIPLGILTGVDILSALGPKLPVQVVSVASAEGTYRNDFSNAGINQTLHRVYLDITITAKLLLPGSIVETVVSTPVCIAETVIIGQVPQTYLDWSP